MAAAGDAAVQEPFTAREIHTDIFKSTNCAEDIAQLQAEGFDVNDDNEPAPKKNPTEQEDQDQDKLEANGQTWVASAIGDLLIN